MTQTHDTYAYVEHGNDLAEQAVELAGLRKIQHFNESPYHRKTAIARGGYGIINEDGHAPPIGQTERVDHRGGNFSSVATAASIEIALIGFSNQYNLLEGAGADGRFHSAISPQWLPQSGLPPGLRMRSAVSLFAALKADPECQLYELVFKGYVVTEAKQMLVNITRACRAMSAAYSQERSKATRVHPFAFWLTLGVGESRMVGTGEGQSPVTPPALLTGLDQHTLEEHMVTRDEYLHFIELRRQVDELLSSGRYASIDAGLALKKN